MAHQRLLVVRLLVIASVLLLADQTYAKSTKQKLKEREARLTQRQLPPGGNRPCAEDEFRCERSQRCIRATWLCDGDNDCGDMSDEDSDTCHGRECPPGHLRCNNGQCINEEPFCALLYRSGCSDESLTPTESCEKVQCREGLELCPSGDKCLHSYMKCDGHDDCGDMSDETDCPDFDCGSYYFKCVSRRRCMPPSFLCNGDDDCGDNSDEDQENCDAYVLSCSDSQFQCETVRKCVPNSFVCDGDDDCGDMSDEPDSSCARQYSTTTTTSPEWELRQCLQTVYETCLKDLEDHFTSRRGNGGIWDVIREAELAETCSQLTQAQDCAWQAVETLGCDIFAIRVDLEELIAMNMTINFVCRQHLEVFEENAECLLTPSEQMYSRELQLMDAYNKQCYSAIQPTPDVPRMCTSQSRQCASSLVSQQCGPEIAGYVDQLYGAIINANRIGCPTEEDLPVSDEIRSLKEKSFGAFLHKTEKKSKISTKSKSQERDKSESDFHILHKMMAQFQL